MDAAIIVRIPSKKKMLRHVCNLDPAIPHSGICENPAASRPPKAPASEAEDTYMPILKYNSSRL